MLLTHRQTHNRPDRLSEKWISNAPPGLISRPMIEALHMARELAVAMVGRPISFANSTYIDECIQSLANIRKKAAKIPMADSRQKKIQDRFIILLQDIIDNVSRQPVVNLISFADRLPDYRDCRRPLTCRPMPTGLLARKKYESVIVIVGPGIGVGDEINFFQFLSGIRAHFPTASCKIFSFFPGVWRTLIPDARTRNLVGKPLAGFEEIESHIQQGKKKTLVLFGNFAGQGMLCPFTWLSYPMDFAEIAVGQGKMWILEASRNNTWLRCELDPTAPSQSRALQKLLHAAIPRIDAVCGHRLNKDLPCRDLATSQKNFRLFINPFTSKECELTPGDWVQYVAAVREALPPETKLQCLVYPGLSDHCNNFANKIIQRGKKPGILQDKDSIGLITTDENTPIVPPKAIYYTYRAMVESDLIISIDTFTAHLAAHTSAPTLNLCLSRNPEFWEEAHNTIWLDMGVGEKWVKNMIRLMVRLDTTPKKPGATSEFDRCCLDLGKLGRPQKWLNSRNDSRHIYEKWYMAADRLWHALGPAARKLLEKADANYAWPVIRATLKQVDHDPENIRRIFDMYTTSAFFRLARMQAQNGRAE